MKYKRIGASVMIIAMLVAALVYIASAQTAREYSLNIIDISEPNCPIEISSGLVSFKETVHADHIDSEWTMQPATFTNVSSKLIIAYEVAIDVVPEHGGRTHHVYRVDYFFKDNLTFEPGSHVLYEIDPSRSTVSGNSINYERRAPKAEIKIKFVNFADGTYYGMSNWGRSLSEGRAIIIQQVNELLHSYQRDGESGLRIALDNLLARPDIVLSAQDKLRVLDQAMRREGAQGVIVMLNKMANAAQRHANMREIAEQTK